MNPDLLDEFAITRSTHDIIITGKYFHLLLSISEDLSEQDKNDLKEYLGKLIIKTKLK